MAIFNSQIKANTTGKIDLPNKQVQEVHIVELNNDVAIEIQLNDYYIDLSGAFTLHGSFAPVGAIDTITAHKQDFSGPVIQTWDAGGETYDVQDLFQIEEQKGDFFKGQKAVVKWLFHLDDQIHGSNKNDKLSGHQGNDFLDGRAGKDQLFGGAGDDTFYFAEGYRKDTIKDFSRREDAIQIDNALATSFKELKKVAETYKNGVELDFAGSDSLKIEGLKMKDLKKVDFEFEV